MTAIAERFPPGDVHDTLDVVVVDGAQADAASIATPPVSRYPPDDVHDTVAVVVLDEEPREQAASISRQASTPSFETLWANHPSHDSPPNNSPCRTNGVSNHDNQCVIRLGVSFARSGISLASYPGAFCWSGHGREHPLRVEEMKDWLNSTDANLVGRAEISRRDSAGRQRTHADYRGRRGIVAFRNFHGTGNQGDHIDLWNGTAMGLGSDDYFERSEEIWFWPLP